MELLAYGANKVIAVIIINIILICVFAIFVFRNIKRFNKIIIISSSMILGGGISNLIDRLFKGAVIDYIDINYLFKYPIFNLADIFIVIGVLLIIISILFRKIEGQEK